MLGCCHNLFAALSRAATKSLAARLRNIGLGAVATNWPRRAAICETCHLRVRVGGVSYCGRPLLQNIRRLPAIDGCGCPTHDKARSPGEHCPLDMHNRAARAIDGSCNCKWCRATASS
jgi:hypothetical protein